MKGFLKKMTGSTVDNHTRDCTWSTCKGGNSYTTIVATTPNTGSYGWIVSNASSQSCLVRVKALDTDGYPVDVSNSTFTITNN